jgi:hypothetical protein
VIDSKGAHKEKRARLKVTRPKPTIYGNCDSWNFIVGKKPGVQPEGHSNWAVAGGQQESYSQLFNNFGGRAWGTSCGRLWMCRGELRNIPHRGGRLADMPQCLRRDCRFYRNPVLKTGGKLAAQTNKSPRPLTIFFRPVFF